MFFWYNGLHMNSQKRNSIIGVLVLVLIIGLSVVFYESKGKTDTGVPSQVGTTTDTTVDIATTTIVDLGGGVTTTVPKGYTVEIVKGSGVPQPIPSLTRTVIVASAVDTRVKTVIEAKVPELQAVLKKDPTKFDYWIDLGMYFKVAGDYTGAKLYWDYAGKLAPTDYISFGNLGNMYAYQLKDIAKAEIYYNQAIKNGPKQAYIYVQFAQMYIDFGNNKQKALAIIDRGLNSVPGDKSLLEFKTRLQ